MVLLQSHEIKAKFDSLNNDWRAIRQMDDKDRQQIIGSFNIHLEQISHSLKAIRMGDPAKGILPRDISLAQYVEEEYGILRGDMDTPDNFLRVLGLSASNTTIDQLMNMPNLQGFRFIVPEVIREAIRQGLRRGPIYPDLIAMDEVVSQDTVITPSIAMSDATPKRIGEAESVPVGTMQFKEKTTTLYKVGKALQISYEVLRKVKLPLLSIYLQDVGVKLGLGLDALAIEVLVSGDVPTEAAPIVGVDQAGQIKYIDILDVWMQMMALGRTPTTILGNKNIVIKAITLDEFKIKEKESQAGNQQLVLRNSLPKANVIFPHSKVPVNSLLFVDKNAALVKLTSVPLLVETAKDIKKQLQDSVVTTTVGFAKMFQDATVVLTNTDTLANLPYPDYMDVDAAENVSFEN